LQLSVDVTNTGPVAGDDVVQLYVAARGSKVERAARELKAFARITVAPGDTQTVSLSVPVSELAYYDEPSGWVVEPLEYDALIAQHAEDRSALSARFRVV
jgi:beta-glucosidase